MVYGSRESNSREKPTAYKSSNDRISRSYRSPPLTSRVAADRYDDRYEDDHKSRRGEESSGPGYFSNFYRERFGSHSPEDYRNLRLSQFDRALSKNDIRVLLEREFKALAPFEIKVVQNPEDDGRLAYVNFERPDCAKSIRRNMIPRLQKVLGRRIALDPTGVIRDQEGKYIPDRYNRAAMAAEQHSPRTRRRSGSYDNRSSSYSRAAPAPIPKRRENGFMNLNQDDELASRTLYVGNLPNDIRETELRRIFEIYGAIDEIDVKMKPDTSFAFVLYQRVEDAMDALHSQHNKPLRPGSIRCQIGYGKSQQSARLYIGRLGPWASADLILSEFDRYGEIDAIDYEPGNSFAYIRFMSVNSAVDACSRMKNFSFGDGNSIVVDFVKDDRPRKRGRSFSDDEFDAKRSNLDALSDGRCWSPSGAGYITSLDELRDQFACTWKGIVNLKKTDYSLSMHRVFGKEHLLQELLRDPDGNALRLNIEQRLKLDNDYYQEMIELGARDLALMIAVEGSVSTDRIVSYLQEKEAAGLVMLNGCTVNVLPHSIVAERLLKFFAPRIAVFKPGTNYLLVALRVNRKKVDAPPLPTPSTSSENAEPSTSQRNLLKPKLEQSSGPPPSLKLRVKEEEPDDDKIEQMHLERLQYKHLQIKVKREPGIPPLLEPAPEPPQLSAYNPRPCADLDEDEEQAYTDELMMNNKARQDAAAAAALKSNIKRENCEGSRSSSSSSGEAETSEEDDDSADERTEKDNGRDGKERKATGSESGESEDDV